MKWIKKISFHHKLLFSYIVMASLFLLAIFILFYHITFKTLLSLYQDNLSAILDLKNDMMDKDFRKIETMTSYMIIDRQLFDTFEDIDDSDLSLVRADRSLTNVLNQYIVSSDIDCSIMLATNRYVFGQQKSNIPVSNYAASDIYSEIEEKGQDHFWIPSYQVAEKFHLEIPEELPDREYYFSYAQKLNLKAASYYYNGYISEPLRRSISSPALLVTLSSDYFKENLEGIIPVKDTFYFVMDSCRQLIYHSDPGLISKVFSGQIEKNDDGMQTVQDEGTDYLLCHSTSDVTGWSTYAAIPYEDIGKTILLTMLRKLVIILSILTVCCIIFVYLVSRLLSKPIRILSHAMGETGRGNFDTQIEYQPKDEFGEIFTRFNKMNYKIKELIDSNYKTTLRRQEAELSALHFQLNPHFLYNTLNIINLMILKGENDLSSNIILRLSKMLSYTTDSSHQKVPLSQDLEWLSNYFYITNIRFGSRISMQMNIMPELNDSLVPKLFLQPFIENAVIHGFRGRTEGCRINISGFLFDQKCIFEVEDNGCGISADKLKELNNISCSSVGISNIRHRIALLYSEEYTVQIHSEPGKGTHVIITLPFETVPPDQNRITDLA